MPSYGTAGGSLTDATFTANEDTARVGQVGEQATAVLLDAQAKQRGFTVLHDISLPGLRANIDHVVVAGDQVTVIDSKTWMPGFYWTLRGVTRRGLAPVTFADKRGLPLVHNRLSEHLKSRGLAPRMQRPLMLIHPSRRAGKVTLWAYRPASDPTAQVSAIHPAQLRFPAKPADPNIVAALTQLLN